MKTLSALFILAIGCLQAEPQADSKPLRIFIRAGKKTHGPGEHDHPRFLAEWKELLAQRGAKTDGSMEFPTAEQLAATDVLVLFCAEGGTMSADERSRLDAYLKRGAGIVVLHDAVCGNDAPWFKTVVGGAWAHGKAKFHHGNIGLYFKDKEHPTTKGFANFFMDDEIYWDLDMMPEAQVLAVGFRTEKEITPQLWVYEKDDYRAFVSIQGHKHASFGIPAYRALLLRGIAWAGKRDADLLVTKDELAVLRYPPGGPLRPDKAHEQIVVHPEFDISLVGAEPDVVKPISMDWDAKGRLWVAMTPMYPEKAGIWKSKPFDRIVILDGKNTVFTRDLDLVTSFVFHRDGVIVMQSPEILFLRDTDGDGKADAREALFTGFGFGDTHAVASNLRWGLDGWIYATQGYSGGGSNHVTNAKGHDFGKIGNGIFRFKPDGSAIEVVSSYGANTWGQDFRWDGEHFFTMANESHLRHVVMPENALARGRVGKTESWKQINDHRDCSPAVKHTLVPYLQIDCVGGFTAAAGSTLYQGGAWPAEFNGSHFVTECTVNLIHQDVIAPDGTTFRASKSRTEEFVAARDLWFRPVDTRVGPDGALYVADFYNQAVVHNDTRGPRHGPFNAAVRPDRDHEHGRIWRIQHKQALPLAKASFETTADLVKSLEHPNMWVRMTAQRLLIERGEGAAELATPMPHAYSRVHALWILQQIGRLTPQRIVAALADPDPGVRKNGAKVAALLAKGEDVQKALLALLEDPDSRVRLEAIVALASFPLTNESAKALMKAYPSLTDNYSRSAFLGTAAASPLEFITADAPRELVEELAGAKKSADVAALFLVRLAALPEATAQAALRRLFATLRPDAVPALTPELRKAFETLLASKNQQVVSATLPFVLRWDSDGTLSKSVASMADALLAGLNDPKQSDEVRSQNLATLLAMSYARAKAIEAAAKILESAASAELQLAVIEALGNTTEALVAGALVTAYPRLTGAARDAAFSQLAKRPEWTAHLLSEIEKKNINPGSLGAQAIFRLRTHPDKAMAKRASAVIDAVLGVEIKAKDEIIAKLLPVVVKPGDAVKGKKLLLDNCLKCHAYKGEGKNVGPDLTGIGAHGPAELLVQIIDPNRAAEQNYVSFNVKTRGGEVLNGVIARDTKDSIVLKNADGEREIRRSDIEMTASTGMSLMPTGLESLGGEALRDILSYLCGDAGGFRLVDIQGVATASSKRGLYDAKREPNNFRPKKYGIHVIDGIPFNVVDPEKSVSGNNAIVLKGGNAPTWDSKSKMPKRVEIPVGFAIEKLHVLGGIAAWGTLDPARPPEPAVKLTWHYADGKTEVKILHDGVEFSDWIRRVDVPGSKYVEGFLERGAPGQLRWFTLRPGRAEAIHHVSLESYDSTVAPTFIAFTAELAGAQVDSKILIVGGGSSHDYDKWWKGADAALLGAAYTSDPGAILPALGKLEVLYLTNNQPIPDRAARKAIFDFADAGKGILLVHASMWYNWKDWPEYNQQFVSGGSRGHEALQEFEVVVNDAAHPIMAGVPATFKVVDELYQFVKDPKGPDLHILATGKSLKTGKEYPVAYIVKHDKRRIVCITLGHDGRAHDHEAYKKMLQNAASWLGPKK